MSYKFSYICPWYLQTMDCNTSNSSCEFSYRQGIYNDNTLHHWYHCNMCHILSRQFFPQK